MAEGEQEKREGCGYSGEKDPASVPRRLGRRRGDEEIFLRNHITYILEKAWSVIFIFLAAVFGNEHFRRLMIDFMEKEEIDRELREYSLWVAGAFAIFLLLFLNRWYRTTFVVKDGTITYRQQTLTRRINTLSVLQISNVNIEQNLFEMVCGTCRMRLDTDSLTTADTTDMELILKKKKAEQVRQWILKVQREMRQEEEEEAAPEEVFDVVYSFREVLVSGLLSITVLQLAAFLGFLYSLVPTFRLILRNLAREDFQAVVGNIILLAAETVASFSILWAILKKILRDFHFRARRAGDQIFVACGLWKKKSYMVPVGKINAVKIEYPAIGRIFGRGYLRVLNVGGEGEEADGMKLLLLGTYRDLARRMEILLPEYSLPDMEKRIRIPRQWMYIRGVSAAFLGTVCGLFAYGGAAITMGPARCGGDVRLVSCLVGITGMFLWLMLSGLIYRTYAIDYLESELLLVHGIFRKEISLIPYRRIQYICYQQGPLERFFGLQHGYVSLLASVVSRYRSMGSFRVEDFTPLEEKVREYY